MYEVLNSNSRGKVSPSEWHRDMKWENTVGKKEPTDLLDTELPQNFNLKKKKRKEKKNTLVYLKYNKVKHNKIRMSEDQLNRTGSLKVNLYFHYLLNFQQGAKAMRKEEVFSIKLLEKLDVHMEKIGHNYYFTPHTKMNLR